MQRLHFSSCRFLNNLSYAQFSFSLQIRCTIHSSIFLCTPIDSITSGINKNKIKTYYFMCARSTRHNFSFKQSNFSLCKILFNHNNLNIHTRKISLNLFNNMVCNNSISNIVTRNYILSIEFLPRSHSQGFTQTSLLDLFNLIQNK